MEEESNPYMDPNEDPEEQPVFEEPDEDEPVIRIHWMCSGVASGSLKRKSSEPHMLPTGSKPTQPTTDASGAFMAGGCSDCGASTIWKKVTL